MALGRKTGGRQKGSRNKRQPKPKTTYEVPEGILPLDVMLQTMREAWGKGDKAAAVSVAKDAAPYVHARLIAQDNKADLSQHYMARAPLPAANDETWQAQHSPTLQ